MVELVLSFPSSRSDLERSEARARRKCAVLESVVCCAQREAADCDRAGGGEDAGVWVTRGGHEINPNIAGTVRGGWFE